MNDATISLLILAATVGLFLPMAVVMAMRRSFPPSQLLMPLAFAGSAGGLLLLTGSPVNVVVSEAAADAGYGEFGFLEFAWVGLPLVAGTILIILFFGARLLPNRLSSTLPPDLSRHAQTLIEHYSLDKVFHFRVNEGSLLLGSPSSVNPRSHDATPANVMVMGPGDYRFGDYWKLGAPLMALFFAVGVFVVPLVWPL